MQSAFYEFRSHTYKSMYFMNEIQSLRFRICQCKVIAGGPEDLLIFLSQIIIVCIMRQSALLELQKNIEVFESTSPHMFLFTHPCYQH